MKLNATSTHNRRLLLRYILLVFLLAPLSLKSQDRATCRGWHSGAVALEQDQVIPSPDQKYRVVLGGYSENEESGRGWLRLFEGPRLLSKLTLKNLSAGVWLNWSPDSKAFFLMWSAGGALGRYHVRVFRIQRNRVAELPTTRIAESDFAKRHSCEFRGNNSIAFRWVNNSDSLLIASEIYDTSDCGVEMGLTMAYLVRTNDGKIIKRYSESETDNLYKTCSPFMD
jgi:hypothetical protein